MDSGTSCSDILYEYVFQNVYVRTLQPLSSKQLKHFEDNYGKCLDINKFKEEIMVDGKMNIRIQRKF